jgi:uncharacterized membrane protein YjgN (DUF898 family)
MDNLACNSSELAPDQTRHRLQFTATVSEYSRLWLANLALTIITLGLYGPWAKVRRERYLLGHTVLDGATFDYTANPVKILKGRLFVIGVFVLASVTKSLSPIVFLILFIIPIAVVYPWAVTMAVRFRCRYTSYRNIQFSFSGRPVDTFWRLVAPSLLSAVSLGALFPWAQHKGRKYIIEHAGYGVDRFSFNASVRSFYTAYFWSVVLASSLLIISISARIALPLFVGSHSLFKSASLILLALSGFAIFAAYFLVRGWILRLTCNSMTLGEYRIATALDPRQYTWIAASNLIIRILSFGLLTPLCVIRMRRYLVESISLYGPQSIDQFVAARQQEISSLGDQAADIYDLDVDFGF